MGLIGSCDVKPYATPGEVAVKPCGQTLKELHIGESSAYRRVARASRVLAIASRNRGLPSGSAHPPFCRLPSTFSFGNPHRLQQSKTRRDRLGLTPLRIGNHPGRHRSVATYSQSWKFPSNSDEYC